MLYIGEKHFEKKVTASLFDNNPDMFQELSEISSGEANNDYIFSVIEELPDSNDKLLTTNFVGVLYSPGTYSYAFVNLGLDVDKKKYLISFYSVATYSWRHLFINPFVKPVWLDTNVYAIDGCLKEDQSSYYCENKLSLLNVLSGRFCSIGAPIEKLFNKLSISVLYVKIVPSKGIGYNLKQEDNLKYELVISLGSRDKGCEFAILTFGLRIINQKTKPAFYILNGFKSSVTGSEVIPLYDTKKACSWLSSETFFNGLANYGFKLENILYDGRLRRKY